MAAALDSRKRFLCYCHIHESRSGFYSQGLRYELLVRILEIPGWAIFQLATGSHASQPEYSGTACSDTLTSMMIKIFTATTGVKTLAEESEWVVGYYGCVLSLVTPATNMKLSSNQNEQTSPHQGKPR
jgi:hypothetical protein